MYASSINERYIDEIVEALRRGEVVIYPTDTAYAVGCDALQNRAVERVCRIKGLNPQKQRLSIVCADLSQASEFARIDNKAFRVLRANLPGPFTFVLPANTRLAKAFKGRREAGVRVPDNAIARRLAEALGNPLLSSTASWEGAHPDDLENPEAVALHYEGEGPDLMIDGGAAPWPGGSAVVSLIDPASPEILREGPKPLRE